MLLHAGVGKASAAAATTLLLETLRPKLVINFGCGGAYPGSELQVGDLALASEEIYGDEGVESPEGFLDMERLGFALAQKNGHRYFNRFPVAAEALEMARPLLAQTAAASGCRLALGPAVTVSCCSGTDQTARTLARRTGGICESMEGAAVAQVCALYTTPFLEIRGISNLTEDRDLARWDLKGGARIAQQAVLTLLEGWHSAKEPA